jgi:Protein of unknown function (DUF1236)
MKYLLVSAAAVMALTGAAAIGNAQMQDKDKGQSPGASSPGAGGGGSAERTQGGGGSAERAPGGGGSDRAQQPMDGQKDKPGKGAEKERGKGEPKAAQQRDQQPKSTQGTQTDKSDKMDRKSDAQSDKDQKKASDQQQRQQDRKAADQQRHQDQKKAADDRRQQQDQKKAADQQQRQQQQDQKAADKQRDQDKKAADQRQPGDKQTGDKKAAEGGDQKRVQVSDQQRTTVREQITRDRNIQRVERSRINVDIRVGVNLPRSVRLHTLPVTLVSTVPAYRGYSYIVLEDDTICIVDPRTYVIVDVIDARGGGLRAERSPGGVRLTLSQEDMRFIYRTVPKERRANVNVRLALGAEVPRDVELIDFPAEVVERVPDVRRYRYVVTDTDVVIVDPNDFQVALVIND